MPQTQELLVTLREEFAAQMAEMDRYVPRDYHFPQVPKMVQVAIGMRRVGKTQFILQEVKRIVKTGVSFDQILYLNFEDDRLLPLGKENLAELLEAYYTLYPSNHDKQCYFFLDEIQNVTEWPIVIRRFLDSKKVKIYLTGSSAKLLSKEIATSLRGRSIATEIWPYDFNEYLLAHHIQIPAKVLSKQKQDVYQKHLYEYLIKGGFPAVQHIQEADRRLILQNYVDTVVYRDIIERYEITNIELIKYLVKAMLNFTACDYSPNKFYNDLKSKGFKVAKDTVYSYINYIEDAFLSFTVPLFSESLRKTQVNPKKIYAVDSGLFNAYVMSFSQNLGRMFENQFYIYLRKNRHEVFYYKTLEGYEIDFFTRDLNGKFHVYQVVWDISDKETLAREERAIASAEKELGIKGKIITPNEFLRLFCEEE